MQVKSIAECSAILLTFIKLPFVIKIYVLSIFELLFYTGFTVLKLFSVKCFRSNRWPSVICRMQYPEKCLCLGGDQAQYFICVL